MLAFVAGAGLVIGRNLDEVRGEARAKRLPFACFLRARLLVISP